MAVICSCSRFWQKRHVTHTREPRAHLKAGEGGPMAADKTKHDLPRAVWALGLTALFMDTSFELIQGLLPVFLVVTLGASAIALGAIEGTPRQRRRLPACSRA